MTFRYVNISCADLTGFQYNDIIVSHIMDGLPMCSQQLGCYSRQTNSFFQPPFYSRDTAEMYDNILYKPLRLRTNVSYSARSILEGVGRNDYVFQDKSLKDHCWFTQ